VCAVTRSRFARQSQTSFTVTNFYEMRTKQHIALACSTTRTITKIGGKCKAENFGATAHLALCRVRVELPEYLSRDPPIWRAWYSRYPQVRPDTRSLSVTGVPYITQGKGHCIKFLLSMMVQPPTKGSIIIRLIVPPVGEYCKTELATRGSAIEWAEEMN
jgi:hypothetical protein